VFHLRIDAAVNLSEMVLKGFLIGTQLLDFGLQIGPIFSLTLDLLIIL